MGIFGWLKPEEEPEDRIVGEISNDQGDHVVFDIASEDEGAMRRIMRDEGIDRDRDDHLSRQRGADEKWDRRDHDQHRYHMDRVVDASEDLEAEVDDDSVEERDEQPAEGGWFSWW